MVYAESTQTTAVEKATATRNEVNIAINDKTIKIVAYNIDGNNYLRVADVGMALGMKTIYYVTDLGDGVKYVSDKPFNGTLETAPADKTLSVTIKDFYVYYDDGYTIARHLSSVAETM